MVQIENPESSVAQRRKILLLGVEPSLQGLISTFLVTMGWAWTVVYDVEQAFGLLQREAFDALLIDLGRLEPHAEQTILGIKQIRPSLGDRILVIADSAADRKMLELIERYDLIQVSPLQQLWFTLQDLCVRPRSSELSRRGMPTAQMIFDSSRNPLPAGGIRSLLAGVRHLAYQHQKTMIDLTIEPIPESRRISFVGQVLGGDAKRKNEGLSVLLVNGTGTLARTATNEFGEFHMEFDSPQSANLEIRLGEQSWVMVPLGRLDGVGKSLSNQELA